MLAATATIALVVGLLLGAGAVLAQEPPASDVGPAQATAADVAPHAVPAIPPTVEVGSSGTATSGGATAMAGAAIAYPYVAGTPGVAPDNTIVVTGVGQAEIKSDGSDRVAAEKRAIADALADAKAQADAIAAGTGLSITGTLSVSASVAPSYGIYPLAGSGSGTPDCPPVPVPQRGSAPGITTTPPVCQPSQQVLTVTATVAYRVS